MRSDEELRRLVSHHPAAVALVMILARRTMRSSRCATLLLFAAVMLLLTSAPSKAQNVVQPMLSLETKMVLGDVKGRIDHMALDPARNRLFVAELENNSVGVVDLNERKVVHRITGLTEPQVSPMSSQAIPCTSPTAGMARFGCTEVPTTPRLVASPSATTRITSASIRAPGRFWSDMVRGRLRRSIPLREPRSPIFGCQRIRRAFSSIARPTKCS